LVEYNEFEQEILLTLVDLAPSCPDCANALDHIVENRIHIVPEKCSRPHYNPDWTEIHVGEGLWEQDVYKPYIVESVVHEDRHIQQGLMRALSQVGEMEAWKAGIRAENAMGAGPIAWESEFLSLPPTLEGLQRARSMWLDQEGIGYLTWLLPSDWDQIFMTSYKVLMVPYNAK
jgi:hypothetical protein